MSKIHLQVITPIGVLYDQDVDMFLVPTDKGPLAISPQYTTLITACLPFGVLKTVIDGKPNYFAMFGGFLEVTPTGARILADDLEDGYSIDRARAIAARDRAQDRIVRADEGTDILRAQAALYRALARIDAKEKSEGGK